MNTLIQKALQEAYPNIYMLNNINELCNNYRITEEELFEAIDLYSGGEDEVNLYLSFITILVDSTRLSPKIIHNFWNWIRANIDISRGFEYTFYRIHHTVTERNTELPEVTFGKYYLALGLFLLRNIDRIEQLKHKLN